MVKRKLYLICGLLGSLLVPLSACSAAQIRKIEILEETVRQNYIVGEEVRFDELEIKITLNDKNENIYFISKDMIKIGNVDNTKVGEQTLNIKVNCEGNELDLVLMVYFDLPVSVKNIINEINELPELEDLTFINESDISRLNKNYNQLDDFYKTYVTNYKKLASSTEYLKNLKIEHITTSVLNQRTINKYRLNNYIDSLNKNDYNVDSWIYIINIYEQTVEKMYLDENYDKLDTLYKNAIEEISRIITKSEIELEKEKNNKKDSIIYYVDMLNRENYSDEKFNSIEDIKNEYIIKIKNSTSVNEVKEKYTNCITLIENVLTIEEEKEILIDNLVNKKLAEIYSYYSNINLNKYNETNKQSIINLYNKSYNSIKALDDEEEMNGYISEFKHEVTNILTIFEELEIELNDEKSKAASEIKKMYKSIDLNVYDMVNKVLIEEIVEQSIENIKVALTVDEIKIIKSEMVNSINEIPTMLQQAKDALIVRKNKYMASITEYSNQFNSTDYSEDNWNNILELINETKIYLENITVSVSDNEIENVINAMINNVDNILSIDEENELLLNQTKQAAYDKLQSYYSSLNESSFDEAKWRVITNRINYSLEIISNLNNINDINKLVNDTISTIELAK